MKPSTRETQDQILRKVRSIIDEHWYKGYWATSANGYEVLPNDPRATCWCIRGAVQKATGSAIEQLTDDVEARLKRFIPDRFFGVMNDNPLVLMNDDPTTTKEDMLKLIDDALAH